MSDIIFHPGSFRDPSGYIFQWNGKYYRQVNTSYAEEYELLMQSGLYEQLTSRNYLIPHTVNDQFTHHPGVYKILEPEQIPFISYPYEWCFEQLRDAALLTISVLKMALEHGMILKDATPYNIQFYQGRPVFIDTLSFEKYDPQKPWVAYRQFCNLFLFPLYLEYYLKADVQKILSTYIDGIPADITSKMLPLKSGLNIGVWLHVYLQNTVTQSGRQLNGAETFNKKKLLNLVNHLESIIAGFHYKNIRSEWSHYYTETILGKEYLAEKERIFRDLLTEIQIQTALDLGANDGHFAKILAEKGITVVAADHDSRSIGNLYAIIRKEKMQRILPMVLDITNPSPATGFNNRERASFHERMKCQLVLALALIHHLVIGKNIPIPHLAAYFAEIAPVLLIEWVPREDEKVQLMLASRKDIFGDYTESRFEEQFGTYFHIRKRVPVTGTSRVLFLMEKK